MDVDEPGPSRRSQSVVSTSAGPSVRRSTRGPYKKTQQSDNKKESIDLDGHLPGAKDGLGVFPPNSDMARTMLALKLKGMNIYYFPPRVLTTTRQEIQDQEGTVAIRKGRPSISC